MTKPNLADPTPDDVRNFVVAVVGLAIRDWTLGAKRKSGAEIVGITAGQYRIFHERMATGIYNQTIRTMECAGR